MATSLLATKLFVPPVRPGLVPRPRLMQRLGAALSSDLVLVSAPAGFGKTTLVSEWARENKDRVRVAWVSLDEGDNDPVRFWDYFIAALGSLTPGTGETASVMLHSSQPYATESVLTALVNDVTAIPDELAVVLDDYHLVNAEAVHTGVTFLLDHLPPRMHLIIATRVDPALPLPRFRGRGTMLQIGADDLRFNPEEATALLRGLQPPELSARDVGALCERTEGWAVGLKMAALSMRGQQDIPGFIAAFTGSQRYVMDYLMEEVLQKQSPEVRDFLVKTSVLERLAAPLCDSVTGRGGSEEMLAKLESGFGGFLVPLDAARQWYRYHHLITELLRHQLERACDVEEIKQLHRRAGQWCEGHDHPDDAIRHYLKIGDWEGATKLIEKAADSLVKRGEWNTLSAWFQAVPEEVLRAHPPAYAHYADVLTKSGRLETAEAVIGYLEAIPNLEESLRGQLTLYRMLAAYHRGDTKQTLEMGERALEQLGEENGALRARAMHILGLFDMRAGRLDRAQSREEEAVRTARRVGESWVADTAVGNLGLILLLRGRLRQALAAGRQAIDLGVASLSLSLALYERIELGEAARNCQLVVKKSELSGYPEELVYPSYCLAQTMLAMGDVTAAEGAMVKADEASHHQGISPLYRMMHAAFRAMFAIQRGDLAAATQWDSPLSERPLGASGLQHVLARLLIARGDKAAAAEQLRGLYEWAMQADAQGHAIKIRVYQALAAATQDEALGFLADALNMGEPEGFIRTFVDEGKLLAPLLRMASAQGITPEYAARLLAIIEAEERQRKTKAGETPAPPTTGLLSEREMEVLRLLAQGLSDRQIAAKLVVSLGTAKTHVHRILAKLNATSRTHAVTQARELKLL